MSRKSSVKNYSFIKQRQPPVDSVESRHHITAPARKLPANIQRQQRFSLFRKSRPFIKTYIPFVSARFLGVMSVFPPKRSVGPVLPCRHCLPASAVGTANGGLSVACTASLREESASQVGNRRKWRSSSTFSSCRDISLHLCIEKTERKHDFSINNTRYFFKFTGYNISDVCL